jgi:hypothetical protein
VLLRYTNSGGYTKTKPIGDDDDCRFTIIVNSASTAAPIGLPPKINAAVPYCGCILIPLLSVGGRRSVGNENCYAKTFGGD